MAKRKATNLAAPEPAQDARELLLPAGPPPPTPLLAIAIVLLVPLVCSLVVSQAAYGVLTIAAAYILPLGAILALLVTPIGEGNPADSAEAEAEAEAETEAEADAEVEDLEAAALATAAVPADARLQRGVADLKELTAAAEDARGRAEACVARTLQLLMGAAALFQAGVLFADTPPAAAAVALCVACFLVQLPDALGWVFIEALRVPAAVTLNGRLNARRVGLEASCSAAAADLVRRGTARLASLADAYASLTATPAVVTSTSPRGTVVVSTTAPSAPLTFSTAELLRRVAGDEALDPRSARRPNVPPWVARLLRWMNDFGYVARQSPLKVLVTARLVAVLSP